MANITTTLWNGNETTNASNDVSTSGSNEHSENYSPFFNTTSVTNYEKETGTTIPQYEPCSNNEGLVCVAIITAVVSLSALVIGFVLLYLRNKTGRYGSERLKSYRKCSDDVSDEVFFSNATEMDLITDLTNKETTTKTAATATTSTTTEEAATTTQTEAVETATENINKNRENATSFISNGPSRSSMSDSKEKISIQTKVLITPESKNDGSSDLSCRLSNHSLQSAHCYSSVSSNSDEQTLDETNSLDIVDIEKTIVFESLTSMSEEEDNPTINLDLGQEIEMKF